MIKTILLLPGAALFIVWVHACLGRLRNYNLCSAKFKRRLLKEKMQLIIARDRALKLVE